METTALKVPLKKGERIRRELLRKSAMDLDLMVRSDGDHLYLPIKKNMDTGVIGSMGELVKIDMEPVSRPPRTYKDVVDIPAKLKDLLPSSFDIIGEIAILKIPDDLEEYQIEIGRSILNVNRNVRSVCRDNGVKGDFRIRDIEVIAGQEDMETIHVENNLRFKLDPSKVYFSPRLAHERMRVAENIKGGRVLDMFAGIGPFSLTIGRYGSPEEVIGMDLNPDAVEYFRSNIMLNSSQDTVEAYLGDARDAPLGMGVFDSVVMNLPHGSMDFLDTALAVIEEGSIYLYTIMEPGGLRSILPGLIQKAEDASRKIDIKGVREVHNYSPSLSMMAIDINASIPS